MWKLLLTLLAICAVQPCASEVKQVAIIGGGVGGTSSAFFLKQQLGGDVNVTIFERGEELGGRTRSREREGHTYELGASIAWTGNKYIRYLAGEAGLTLNDSPGGDGGDGLFAIWDGEQLVFRESQFMLLTAIRLWWRYGFSFWQLRGRPHDMFLRFSALYPLQEQGASFERPEDFLKALGLYDLTQESLLEWIRDTFGYTDAMDLFAHEVVAAIGRVNYNQGTLQLNALAGLVSLLPSTDPAVFSIKGGNQQLAKRLAAKAGAALVLGTAVAEVAARNDSRGFDVWLAGGKGGCPAPAALLLGGEGGGARLERLRQLRELHGQQEGGHCTVVESYGPFDAVILAAPLEGSDIQLRGLEALPRLPQRKYQQTVTTLVQGALRTEYFNLESMPYSAILVTESAATPFSSLSQVGRGSDSRPIFKLFSAKPLQDAQLGMLFTEGYSVLANKTWKAYPRFDPPEDFAPFKLAEGLFYSNALENAASAMEMAAIAGRNSALLAAKHLQSKL